MSARINSLMDYCFTDIFIDNELKCQNLPIHLKKNIVHGSVLDISPLVENGYPGPEYKVFLRWILVKGMPNVPNLHDGHLKFEGFENAQPPEWPRWCHDAGLSCSKVN